MEGIPHKSQYDEPRNKIILIIVAHCELTAYQGNLAVYLLMQAVYTVYL